MADKVKTPAEIENDKFLDFKVRHRMVQDGFPTTDTYLRRVTYELEIIRATGFSAYFLIVGGICDFMRVNKIRYLARGSGCGSVCVWSLQISHRWLDPLIYNIPFERFLNPERVSNPDLDIDVQDDRRHEVIQFIGERYGMDRVARIITFGTMGARAAIQDVARAQNLPDHAKLAYEINAGIPAAGKPRLVDVLEKSEYVREYQAKNPELFNVAMKIEGRVRHPSIHAAGTIIAPDRLWKFMPTWFTKDPETREIEDNFPTTQWDMYDSEARGLLKMDMLGLKTLRVIDLTVGLINLLRERQGQAPDFDIDKVDQRNDAAWHLLAAGRLAGVFQVERQFVRRFAQRMNLMALKDPWQLAVLVAIIRPGMMDTGQTELYLRRASKQEDAVPLHPLLAETLKATYGLMVFQEDVMFASRALANFNMAKADILRKGIGKKKPEFVAKMKPDYMSGCAVNHVSNEDAERIWELFAAHSRYSFNSAHAGAYGVIGTYQTAYLKANHPLEFMVNLINSEAGVTSRDLGYNYKVAEYVTEADSMGLKVVPPSVRRSNLMCAIVPDGNQIVFGLSLIKGLSDEAAMWIRNFCRDSLNFKDFVSRCWSIRDTTLKGKPIKRSYVQISASEIKSLINAGALDCLERSNRSMMMACLEKVYAICEKLVAQRAKEMSGSKKLKTTSEMLQRDLDNLILEDETYSPAGLEAVLSSERETTGCYLSCSPFAPFSKIRDRECNATPEDLAQGPYEGDATMLGVLTSLRVTVVKNGRSKGQEMAFMTFTGVNGQIECTAFSQLWAELKVIPGGMEPWKVYKLALRFDNRRAGHILQWANRLSAVDQPTQAVVSV